MLVPSEFVHRLKRLEISVFVHPLMDRECDGSNLVNLRRNLPNFPILAVMNAVALHPKAFGIRHLRLSDNGLFGVMDSVPFPFTLKSLDLSGNDLYAFSMPLLRCMPYGLRELFLENNHFYDGGHFSWELLPKPMRRASLHRNEFHGKIDWNQLPLKLESLTVSNAVANISVLSMPSDWRIRPVPGATEFVKKLNLSNDASTLSPYDTLNLLSRRRGWFSSKTNVF